MRLLSDVTGATFIRRLDRAGAFHFQRCWEVASRTSTRQERCASLAQIYSATGAVWEWQFSMLVLLLGASLLGSSDYSLCPATRIIVFSSSRCNLWPLGFQVSILYWSLCPSSPFSWAVTLSRWPEIGSFPHSPHLACRKT